MAIVTQVRFSTGAPSVLNSENGLTVSLPISNDGSSTVSNVWVTGITLGAATRLSPEGLPLFIGVLAPANTANISPRFATTGLAVGSKYLLTVRGTYDIGGTTFGFAVNRYITIPAFAPNPVPLLRADVEVTAEAGVWTYTIFNDEPQTSSQFIATFSLEIVAPVTVIGTPAGWQVDTDNTSYVLWYAADLQLPYPHHIAPGTSLGGFQLASSRTLSESTGFVVTGWDHQADAAGLVFPDLVLSPSRVG